MRHSRTILRILAAALLAALGVLAPFDGGQAQTPRGKKYALLVGVRKYDHSQLTELKYTENDVEELAAVLQKAGFETEVLTTTRGEGKGKKGKQARPTAANIRKQLAAMLKKKTKHDTVLMALSGHGLQFELEEGGKKRDESFFCPADAKPRITKSLKELSETMLSFTEVFKTLDESGVGVKLLLVDACRNEPEGFRSAGVDVLPRPTNGTAALFSCKSGERSFEKANLGKGHGIFFHYVLEGMRGKAVTEDREVTWDRLAEYVKRQVFRQSSKLIGGGARQTPHEIRNLEGDSPVLRENVTVAAPPPLTPTKKTAPPLPTTKKTAPPPTTKKTAPPVKPPAKAHEYVVNRIGMRLVRILPPGTFTMGSPRTERGRHENEEERPVKIGKEFWMGVYEVTQRQFKAVMGYNPSYFCKGGTSKEGLEYGKEKPGGGQDRVPADTNDFPVENVSYDEAVEFCRRLSARPREKKRERLYRLPTEAEWEYACRAGTTTRYHGGDSLDNLKDVGWCKLNSEKRTHAVGEKKANGFGLYDMHGNVAEWCSDLLLKNPPVGKKPDPKALLARPPLVIRGGNWNLSGFSCRSASRTGRQAVEKRGGIGFRVVFVPAGK